jgi:hypothetical protein
MNPMMMHLHELSKTDLMLNQPNQNQSSWAPRGRLTTTGWNPSQTTEYHYC